LTVSAVSFGGIPTQRLSEQEAVDVVLRCLDLGITFLDTANGYTTSEERIGHATARRREGLAVGTRTGPGEGSGVREHLALSLERLRVETLDLYRFHCVSSEEDYQKVLAPGGPLDVVREAQASAKVRHIGLTSHSMEIVLKAVRSGYFETIMFPFNFITDEAAQQLLPLALERDVGFMAMKPLAGGGLDNAALAFKYLRQFPQIVPIPGIERMDEIEEIIVLMEGPAEMTPGEHEEIERLQTELGNCFCRRCGYCQPCPEEVSIQLSMILNSVIIRMNPDHVFTDLAQVVDGAEVCTECGACEERCPYDLPIREMIKEHVALFQAEMARSALV